MAGSKLFSFSTNGFKSPQMMDVERAGLVLDRLCLRNVLKSNVSLYFYCFKVDCQNRLQIQMKIKWHIPPAFCIFQHRHENQISLNYQC